MYVRLARRRLPRCAPVRRCSFSVARLLTYLLSISRSGRSSVKSITDALRRRECSSSHCWRLELHRRGQLVQSFIIVLRSVHRVMLQAEGCLAVLMPTRYATLLFFCKITSLRWCLVTSTFRFLNKCCEAYEVEVTKCEMCDPHVSCFTEFTGYTAS